MLYLADNCNASEDVVCRVFECAMPKDKIYRDFTIKLFKGVCDRKEEIDTLIKKYAKNWELNRMAVVDRNIIRLAAYEIIDIPSIPVNVVIDEAVEISKRYSTKDSSKFVNGILDKLKIARN
jgi:N utilization substance protein B